MRGTAGFRGRWWPPSPGPSGPVRRSSAACSRPARGGLRGLRPKGVNLLADDGPFLDPRSRGRDLQGVVLHGADEILNGGQERIHQDRRRGDDENTGGDDQQGGGEALSATDPVREP